jgi:hypothetical protein
MLPAAVIREEMIMNIRVVGWLAAIAASAVVLTAGDTLAQGRRRGGQPVHYNIAAEVTVSGSVEDFKQGPAQGTHVILSTRDGSLELALGPAWYQTDKKYTLAKGDQIEVTGAKSKVDDREVVLVREIKKGSETMTFRDAKGLPLWAGRGRR